MNDLICVLKLKKKETLPLLRNLRCHFEMNYYYRPYNTVNKQ